MIARIVIEQNSKIVFSQEEIMKLEEFLGETVNAEELKMTSEGLSTKSWRETFSKDEVEKDSDYTLVERSEMFYLVDSKTFLVDIESFMSHYPKIEFKVKGVPKSIDLNQGLVANINEISKKIDGAMEKFDRSVSFNEKCEVHVPNLGLMNINRLAYATDYCTVQLQDLLDKGWRIISVCPQPDQRLPDYVLGMSVFGENESVRVKHFNGNGRELELA